METLACCYRINQCVQLLCFVQKVEKQKPRRKIGFVIDGIETEA
jgi:hypothetical protein